MVNNKSWKKNPIKPEWLTWIYQNCLVFVLDPYFTAYATIPFWLGICNPLCTTKNQGELVAAHMQNGGLGFESGTPKNPNPFHKGNPRNANHQPRPPIHHWLRDVVFVGNVLLVLIFSVLTSRITGWYGSFHWKPQEQMSLEVGWFLRSGKS